MEPSSCCCICASCCCSSSCTCSAAAAAADSCSLLQHRRSCRWHAGISVRASSKWSATYTPC
jgi:hypothetical protein